MSEETSNEVKRGPGRPARPTEGRSDSRTDLLKSMRERSMANRVEQDEASIDPFYVSEALKDPAFDYQWIATHVMGQPVKTSELTKVEQSGWLPVPFELFKSMRPKGFSAETIEQDGQTLMMRPKEFSDEAKKKRHIAARSQVGDNLARLGLADAGHGPRANGAKGALVDVKRTVERAEIPD